MKSKIKAFLNDGYLLDCTYRSLKKTAMQKELKKEFQKDKHNFLKNAMSTEKRFANENVIELPSMGDKTLITPIEPHYTYHPAWAARVLAGTKPNKHIDISSTLNFCTIVSAFVPIDFYDYRPANIHLDGLISKKGDLINLPFANESVESLSCMHTLEHIGLGRYGDAIDYDGDLKAMSELKRVLAKDGDLLIVVPIGKAKIEYNTHRIYSYGQIISYFSPLKLIEFSLVPDDFEDVGIIKNATKKMADAQGWGCGCFWFRK